MDYGPHVNATPLDGVDLLLSDLDGVIYAGAEPIPHAIESINRAQASRTIGYLTNNASRTDAEVAQQLTGLGLHVRREEIVTSPQIAAVLLASHVAPGATVLVVGGDGLTAELERSGFIVTRSAADAPAAVVQGFHHTVGWTHLAEASYVLGRDAALPWIATNTDRTIPQSHGVAPGNGTLVAAVQAATGREPIVAGKPERAIYDTAVARLGGVRPLFVGDRLDTDVLGANSAGIDSALVLTGIHGPAQVLAAEPTSRPRYILTDLRDLFEPYPEPVVEVEPRAVRAVSGGAEAVVEAGRMRMQREGSPIESLRAVAAALWASESHGSTIRDETGLDLLSERAIPAKRVGLDT